MASLTLKQLFQFPADVEERLKGKTFVGIDFGTSTTVVSVASYDSKSQRIACDSLQLMQMMADGAISENELLPSVIALTPDKKLLVGEGAYALKGKPDYVFGANIWHSFKMELGKDMGPRWSTTTQSSLIKSPQDATAIFFRYLKRGIEQIVKKNGWSQNLQYAVSIPASFESNQRLDLLQALKKDGIEMAGNTLIDEPNAAFIGYINPDYTTKEPIVLSNGYNPKVLVFDFGAGTCDISILELSADDQGYHSKNISISQFTELGGNDIDRYIACQYLLPELLKRNNMAEDDFNTEQTEVIINQLLGIAEHLKIQCSKAFNFLLRDKESLKTAMLEGQGIDYKKDLSIYTEYGDLVQHEFKLSYEQFIETMQAFLRKENSAVSSTARNRKGYNSIYATIDSAIEKAHIDKAEIDYVMMIGGSSKNPYIQKSVRKYFPKGTRLLIPQDLQALVSQGAALHSLLINGLGIAILRPICSEPIKVVTRGNIESVVIPAGTEIPMPQVEFDKLNTGDHEQSVIEIPICVSNAKKIVANLKIENQQGVPFPKNTPIELTLEMNSDKVLKTTAICMGQVCKVNSENPFANTYLTDQERSILKAERQTYVSADKNNGRPSKQSLINLRKAYLDADQNYQAAEACERQIKYYPDNGFYNYIGVLYHNSGNYTKAIRYFKKALEVNETNVWAWSNLGNDLYIIGKNQEAKKCLERALEIKGDKTSALSVMGDIYRDQGDDEKAQEYYERCYNVFMRKWKNDALNEVDYGWFEDVARKLGRYDMAAKIANDRPTKAQSQNYNAENLVTLQKKNKGEEDEE